MSHTPGPWHVEPLNGKYYGTRVVLGDHVLEVWTSDHFANPFASKREIELGWDPVEDGHDHIEDVRSYANACLIAAAPELLEALKSAVETIEWMRACTDPAEDEIDKEIEAALAVISKATGE
jgi:hypothetical protein